MRQMIVRRDPAPSRLSYRLQRLALTPAVRKFFLYGLPVASAALLSVVALSDPARRDALVIWADGLRTRVAAIDAFQVRQMVVEGASDTVAEDIREVLGLDFPVSSLDLSLPLLRDAVVELDAIERADLRVVSGGTLHVRVNERAPAVMWRTATGLELLDGEGHRTAEVTLRVDRPDLPLISGEGAERAVPEALRLLQIAAPLAERIRGLVRIGARRWDVVLDRGQRVMLPEAGAGAALERVVAVETREALLSRDVALVDMRNPRRPTVRLAPDAATSLRTQKRTELGSE